MCYLAQKDLSQYGWPRLSLTNRRIIRPQGRGNMSWNWGKFPRGNRLRFSSMQACFIAPGVMQQLLRKAATLRFEPYQRLAKGIGHIFNRSPGACVQFHGHALSVDRLHG